MEGDDVRARVGEVVDIPQRIAYHQMNVKGLVREGTNPFYYGSAEGEVRDKMTVHNVEVHPVRACLVHARDFLTHF